MRRKWREEYVGKEEIVAQHLRKLRDEGCRDL